MKKSLLFLLALLPIVVPMAVKAQSGACGVSVTWELADGTLTISGEGDMYNNGSTESFSYAIFADQVKKVVFTDGVTSVGDCAFTGFKNLVSVDLSSTIVTIGSQSFKDTGLKSIDFPESVKELLWECFVNTALTKVSVPSNIKHVTGYVFASNSLLKEVYWDMNMPETSYFGFFNEDSIETITFGPNVKIISDDFMYGVVPGYKIISSGSIEYIGHGAFEGSKWLSEHINEAVLYFDKCLYTCGEGLNSTTHVEIKEGTISLTSRAFAGNRFITGVTIPESMKIMGGDAFYECASLSNVVWNAIDCKVFGSPNFGGNLSNISFGDKVMALPASLCEYCTGLTSLSFPESLKTIGGGAFYGCSGIESIQFNEQLDSIAEGAFQGCTKIKSLNLTARVIETRVFDSLEDIADINISNNVKVIRPNFYATKLEELSLPSTLESVEYIFTEGHIGKVYVECPDAERVVGSAFVDRAVINNMEFADGIKTCPYFSVVDTVTVSESVVKMNGGEAATLIYKAVAAEESGSIHCNNVIFSEGVQIIPAELLIWSSISKVELPASVTKIGYNAFGWCEDLLSVTAPWYDPRGIINIDENPFEGINEEATLYVPKGRIEAYKNLFPWSEFRYIKEIDGSTEIDEVEVPVITYENGELHFTSATPNAEYHYSISDPDIVTEQTTDGSVWLNAYYEISVYASATGLINSGIATAKLYFIEANLEGAGTIDAPYRRGVLVSTSGNTLTVSGLDHNEAVEVYDISGRLVGKGNSISGKCAVTVDSDQSILLVHTSTETIKVRR